MKRADFDNLLVDDICVITRGLDQGKRVIVRYIEDEQILVRSLDGPFEGHHSCKGKLKLTGWHELDILT